MQCKGIPFELNQAKTLTNFAIASCNIPLKIEYVVHQSHCKPRIPCLSNNNLEESGSKVGQKVLFAYETIEEALNIDQYSSAVQIFPRDRIAPVTVGHILMELSRFVYYFVQSDGGLSGRVLSTRYKRSPVPEGGLEIPISVKCQHPDENILDKMKEFVTNNYTEVAEIEVLEDSYEDQEDCNIVLSA